MNPLAMACRACAAAPGIACEWDAYGNATSTNMPSSRGEHHATRVSDALLSEAVRVELSHREQQAAIARAARPAVIVRKSTRTTGQGF